MNLQSNPSPVTVAFTNSPSASICKDISLVKLPYDNNNSSTSCQPFPVITASNNQNLLMKNISTPVPMNYEGVRESSSLFNNNCNNYSIDNINPMPAYDDSLGPLSQWQNNNNYPVKIDSVDVMHF